VTVNAREYLSTPTMRAVKWNGREIRNGESRLENSQERVLTSCSPHIAFQTAVALAEYKGETDADGKIVLTDNHLRAMVELSSDFKGYLDELHMANEEKRSQKRVERLDYSP
jgi:hypothetical protein